MNPNYCYQDYSRKDRMWVVFKQGVKIFDFKKKGSCLIFSLITDCCSGHEKLAQAMGNRYDTRYASRIISNAYDLIHGGFVKIIQEKERVGGLIANCFSMSSNAVYQVKETAEGLSCGCTLYEKYGICYHTLAVMIIQTRIKEMKNESKLLLSSLQQENQEVGNIQKFKKEL